MLTKLFNELGIESTKEKIIAVAKLVGVALCCFAAVELLRVFMWLCYDAGIPM